MGEYAIKVSASDYASAVTFADYYDLYYLIELNRISEFRFIAFGLSAAQKAVLIEGSIVYIFYDSDLVLKGEIRKADIDDELEEYHIEGNGMAITLLDRDVRGRNQWDDTEADTIVKSLISGIMDEGTIESAIKVGFRAEEDSVLRGCVSLTKAIDWDWYVNQDIGSLGKVDYTTFTEVDPNSHLALVGTDHLDFDAHKNEDCYLYKDYGASFFGDFEHKVDVKVTGLDENDEGYVWLLGNDIDDVLGLKTANKNYVGVFFEGRIIAKRIYLTEGINGIEYQDYYNISQDTWYYLTITKTGTLLTCKIYDSAARTNLLDTLSLTLQVDYNFRYLFGCNTWNSGVANVCTLDIENLSVEDYTPDEFNFVANKGETTSQETFILGDDIFRIQRSKDVDNVFNVVRVLGYGDGVNQIMSESFYATTNRATLSAAITAAAASLTVTEDISSFPASGNLRCGREWIVYSAKNDGTKTFTISARGNIPGANPPSDNPYYIAAYAHKKGAEIFDLQYSDAGFATKATAQAGTSIKTYGLRDNLYPDQAIRNQSTVDLLAQRLVNKYNIPVERIELSTAEEVLTAAIGDIVSIEERDDYTITGINQGTKTFTIAGDYASEFTDTYDAFRVSGSTGNDGRYTIVSGTFDTDHTDIVVSEAIPDATVDGTINPHVEYRLLKEEFNYDDYSMSLVLGNAQDFFLEAFGELKKKMDINSVYGLGNTVAFSLPSFAQNIEKTAADNFYSYMQFKIPKNCKAVNITDLFWYLDNFRAPSKVTAGGSAHSHSITGQATAAGSAHTHSITGKATSGGAAHSHGFGAAETTQAVDAEYESGYLITAFGTRYVALRAHIHKITTISGVPDYPIGFKSGQPCSSLYGNTCAGDNIETNSVYSGDELIVAISALSAAYDLTKKTHVHKLQGATTVDESTHTHPITGIATDSESAHTHAITGQATESESAHTHVIEYGVQEEAAPANIIKVEINPHGGGWQEITGSPFTGDQAEVDIKGYIDPDDATRTILMRFLPNANGRCWMRGGGEFQGFIESK